MNEKVHALIGEFHIYKRPAKEIRQLAKDIKETGISYICMGHCSGNKGYEILYESNELTV